MLGCGATIARYRAAGARVTVAIVTRGKPPVFPASQVRRVRTEARQAADLLGHELEFLDLPVTELHRLPLAKINGVFSDLLARTRPDWLLLPHPGDRHEDHRQVFAAAMVASRPDGRRHRVARIACYETVSETHWSAPGIEPAFEPNWFVDVSETLETKLRAMACYASQLEAGIPARSLEAIEALARFRGSVVGVQSAEAFQIIRDLS